MCMRMPGYFGDLEDGRSLEGIGGNLDGAVEQEEEDEPDEACVGEQEEDDEPDKEDPLQVEE